MIEINNTKYRNLQEQVLQNQKDIAEHYNIDRVLADFGIRIIGRVDTPEDITTQPVPVGGYQYGDAYAVGAEGTNYDYYIYTRPFDGEAEDHWFDIGSLTIAGPQGPQGEKGDTGATGASTRWYSVTNFPSTSTTQEPAGTMLLVRSNGNVYESNGSSWQYKTNIKGPKGDKGDKGDRGETGSQGIQGPVGPAGPQGNGIVILGDDLTSIEQLPDPTTIRRDGAYLVIQNGEKHLYAIVGLGTTASPLVWEDLGVFAYTINAAPTKLYLHNTDIYFDLHGTNTYLKLKIINSNSERITMDTIYAEMQTNLVSVIPRMDYGNSNYFLMTNIKTTTDGYDYFYQVDYVDFASYGTYGSSDYLYYLNTVYDSVREL